VRRNKSHIVLRKPVTIFLLFSLLVFQHLNSQEKFIDPPAKQLTSFSFRQLTGGVIIFRALFSDYKDTLNFILDTGSGGISLDSATVTEMGITPVPSNLTILGIAGIRKVSFIYNQKLKLPGLTIDSLNYHINDYEILTSVYGEKIDGIVGYSVLSRYIFHINYDNYTISIFSNGTIKYPKGGWLYEPVLRTLPIQNARIKDAKTINTRLLFDIGAGLCVMLNKEFIDDSNFLSKKRVFYSKEAEGVGGKIDLDMTVIKEVRLGPYKFRNVPIFVFEDTFNVTTYPYLGGILGNDLLRRFNLYLNYAQKEFYMIPNQHFNDQFDYAYSGIELYLIDDYIVIGNVAENSPAEFSGLREGDIVVGMNNLLGQSLQSYKLLLQTIDQKIKLIVNRNGELMEFTFKIKSIL
jgi:hypothetical protein